jgi:sugar lactone lactonase YvrE
MSPSSRILAAAWLTALLPLLVPSTAAALLVPNQVGSYGTGDVSLPMGIAIARTGEAFVVSNGTRRVEKFSRAGTHLLGWGGLGSGPGQFDYPCGVALDPSGIVYVVDVNTSRVQKFSPEGVYLGQFGSVGSGPGEFSSPRAIAIDASGNVYVADTYNHRVQKLTTAGAFVSQWGSQGTGNGQFDLPQGIAVDAAGDVYVADTYNHRVQKFDAAGAYLRQWGSSGSGDGQFAFPDGIHVDAGGNVYVTDVNNHRVQRFTSTGVFVALWGANGSGPGEFVFPQAVAVGPGGDVHVCDTNNNRIQVFRGRDTGGHEALVAWGGPGSGNGEFSDVRGVAVAPDGFVFVADKNGNRMQKFTSFGAWAGAWGSSGSGDGEFSGPTGVAVDATGNVYVTDHLNSRVQKFTGNGSFLSKWGSAGTAAGQFTGIWDIAIDDSDNVYVVDANRVQRFTTGGAFAGQWSCPNGAGVGTDAEGLVYVACTSDNVVRKFKPDGTLALEWGSFGSNPGQFHNPTDVATDSAGYVYVCDSADRIQQFTPLGGYVAEWGEPGSALRQVGAPQMLAVDAAGSVYVSEFLNYRVQKFASPPEILEIADIGGDEGGSARITFTRSSADAPGSGGAPFEYRIQRLQLSPPALIPVASPPLDGVTTTAVVSTGGNATDTLTGINEYHVMALLPIPGAYPLYGYNYGFSVDNLAPPAPSPFTAAYVSGATDLHWGVSPAADLSQYRLYRGDAAEFDLSPATLIHASADTGFADVGPAGRYYSLVAADTSGNVSPPASLGPGQTVAVPDGEPALDFRLEEIRPNPARGRSLVVRFALPDARRARIELIDVAGRAQWSREVSGAGQHSLPVGADRRLAPGIYFVRLARDGSALVRRVAVLD